MRDIGHRIQRYRLSRYGAGEDRTRRWSRWAWPLAAIWLVYIGLLSDHSLFRIWRMSAESARMRAEVDATHRQIEELDRQLNDPTARRELGERTLRERDGLARPGEIIYRIPGAPDTSLVMPEPESRDGQDARP